MSDSFWARDAFVYVDSYRKLIEDSSDSVAVAKAELEAGLWRPGEDSSHYYAKLRAHEDALERLLNDRQPGRVVLGNDSGSGPATAKLADTGSSPESIEQQLSDTLMLKERQIESLHVDLADAHKQVVQLLEANRVARVQLSQRQQQIQRLRQRIYQTNSTSLAIGAVMLLIIVALIVLWISSR